MGGGVRAVARACLLLLLHVLPLAVGCFTLYIGLYPATFQQLQLNMIKDSGDVWLVLLWVSVMMAMAPVFQRIYDLTLGIYAQRFYGMIYDRMLVTNFVVAVSCALVVFALRAMASFSDVDG